MGIWTMAIPGMNPLTGLLAGVTAVVLGPRAGFALGGVALLLTAALGWSALADGGDDEAARRASARGASDHDQRARSPRATPGSGPA